MAGCHSPCAVGLPPPLSARAGNHPCFSEEAHHHYARMHVAVAPACNIQCNYCNRLFDCANESRPGVTSELLTPEEAARKVLVVGSRLPQLSVVGIAGPGDPLANPEKTFRTFELIAEMAPDIKFCLSTNGLRLVDYVDRIKALNIDHVTVTINAVDQEVAKHIYQWVYFEHKRYVGLEASRLLLERQLAGLQALVQKDILCKVNSVLIPGVNDEHLTAVAEKLRSLGVLLHNIMPMIVVGGSHYGRGGYRGPSAVELLQAQKGCGGLVTQMRHCRQCRGDAIGLLGEDHAAEFTKDQFMVAPVAYGLEKRRLTRWEIEQRMAGIKQAQARVYRRSAGTPRQRVRVAVASKGGGLVNQHFGHAKEFLIYEADEEDIRLIGVRNVRQYCYGPDSCGDDEAGLESIIRMLSDCQAILCSRIGLGPQKALGQAGINCVETYDLIVNAVDKAARREEPSDILVLAGR